MTKETNDKDVRPQNVKDKKLLFIGGVVVLALILFVFGGKFMQGLFDITGSNYEGTMEMSPVVSPIAQGLYSAQVGITDISVGDLDPSIENMDAALSYPSNVTITDSEGNTVDTEEIGLISLSLNKDIGTGAIIGDTVDIDEPNIDGNTFYFTVDGKADLRIVKSGITNGYAGYTPTIPGETAGSDIAGSAVKILESIVAVGTTNTPPVANADTAITEMNTLVNINVLSNDSDPDTGDTISLDSITMAPSNGTAVINTTGRPATVDYIPNPNYTGTDTFTYQISDDAGLTDTAIVTVTVIAGTPQNNPPTANDDTATTDMNTLVNINVLSNDSDPDTGDTISLDSITVVPSNGTAVINTTGRPYTVDYIPSADYTGTDTFTYQISDDAGLTDTAIVTVTVNEIGTQAADVSGVVFYDADGSGDNGSEATIPGVTVKLYDSTDTHIGDYISGSHGDYEFDGLTLGTDYYFKIETTEADYYTNRGDVYQNQAGEDDTKIAFTFTTRELVMDIPMYSTDYNSDDAIDGLDVMDFAAALDVAGGWVGYGNDSKPGDLNYNFHVDGLDVMVFADDLDAS